MANKNILHVVNIYFVLPFFIGGQFKYFHQKGYNMNVACSPSNYIANYSRENAFDYLETPINRSFSLKDDLISLYKLCKYIKKRNINIINGHTPKGGLLGMLAGKISGVPNRIYFRHGLVYETSTGFKRFILKNMDRLASLCATKIICVSPSVLQRSIEDRLAPRYKQMIIGNGTCNGIDTDVKFNPDKLSKEKINELQKKYKINTDDFVIGYSGRLVKDKGIEELVNAFENLKDADNCKLLLVGMFEDRDSVSLETKRHIISNPNIIYTGFINQDMEYYYALMDLYILPSYREGFPTGVLEAQSMCLPVLTTKATGCIDSIIPKKTGFYISHDIKDIIEGIDKIRINNSIEGREGRKWVSENFRNQIVWDQIEKLYQK